MPNAIERDVYVLRNTLKNPIAYVRGTDLLPIIFHFRDFAIPSGATATAFTAKPDGNAVYGSATISENDVTVDVQQQMFIVLGLSMLQVEIKSGEETLATFVQPVMVEPNLKAGDFPPSTTDINFLDEVIKQAREAVDNANQAVKDANTAISRANTAASSANQAAQNANQAVEDLQDKVGAGDFTASVQVGTTTTLNPGQDATVSNSGTNKDAVFNFGIPKGDPGTAATIQVGTTQTVQPEENAEVTNSGTANAAVLNFKIPRGEDGMTDLTAEYTDASEYTCQPTVNAPVVVKALDGKTEQVETQGAQLFDASKLLSKTQSGATVTNNGDGSFTVSGSGNLTSDFQIRINLTHEESLKLIKSGTVHLSGIEVRPIPYFFFGIQNSDRTINKEASLDSGTFEVTESDLQDDSLFVTFGFYGSAESKIVYSTIKPMVYQSGDGTWEPYTGGQPAPSPDYPQVIKGAGGMGYFDGEWVQGNISSTGTVGTKTTGITSANAIPCKQNDNIAVTYEDSIDVIAVAFYNASGAYISTSTSGNSVDTFTATAPANAASFKINLRVVNESTIAPNGAKYCTVTINGEYQTGVGVHGAQLLDVSKFTSTTIGNVTITNNGDGSFTVGGSGTISNAVNYSYNFTREETLNLLRVGTLYLKNNVSLSPHFDVLVYSNGAFKEILGTVTIPMSLEITEEMLQAEDLFLRIRFYGNAGEAIKSGTVYPMLYQDGDGTYQPYHHTSLTIPLTSPLYEGDKICYVKPGESYVDADGTTVVADRILYGVYRENGRVVFDGSEDENWEVYESELYRGFSIIIEDMKKNNFNDGFCNLFLVEKQLSDNPRIWLGSTSPSYYSNHMYVHNVNPTYATDVNNWETWLQSHNMTVVYPIATPYFEPFEDQTPFYNLRSFDNLTYIYSDDPLNPALTVGVAKNQTGGYLLESYAQAQKNAISEANSQSRLSAIEQQLVNQATTPTE